MCVFPGGRRGRGGGGREGGCVESKVRRFDSRTTSQPVSKQFRPEKRGRSNLLVVTKRYQRLTSKPSCFADLYASELRRRDGCVDQDPRFCLRFGSYCDWDVSQFHSKANYGQFRTMCCQTCKRKNNYR